MSDDALVVADAKAPGETVVFVSHSSANTIWVVEMLVPHLRAHGLGVRGDFEFPSGINREVNIREAIKQSDKVLAVVTPHWCASDWTKSEWRYADEIGRERHAVKLEPLTGAQKNEFNESFIDLVDPSTYLANLDALTRELGGVEPRSPREPRIPGPTAGYEDVSAPSPAPVLSLDTVVATKATFDLGSSWGLSRLPYVLLIAGDAPDLLRNLSATERTLLDAQARRTHARLPVRLWVELHTGDHPNGPAGPDEVWAATVGAPIAIRDYLRRGDWDPAILAGLIFRAPDTGSGGLETTRLWCRRIFDLFDSRVAVIVEIDASDPDSGIAAVQTLASSLRRDRIPAVIERARVRGAIAIAPRDLATACVDDTLMDSYVSAIDWAVFDADDRALTPRSGAAFVDDIVLALLRHHQRAPANAACVRAILRLKGSVASELAALCEQALQPGPVVIAADADPYEWLLAARAGLSDRIAVPNLAAGDIGPLWWAGTVAPTLDVTQRLLGSNLRSRLAFGLVSEAEYRDALSDRTLMSTVTEIRRGRPCA